MCSFIHAPSYRIVGPEGSPNSLCIPKCVTRTAFDIVAKPGVLQSLAIVNKMCIREIRCVASIDYR